MWYILFYFYFNSLKSEQAKLTASRSQNVAVNDCITEILYHTNWNLLFLGEKRLMKYWNKMENN